jgi:hypothetical protein
MPDFSKTWRKHPFLLKAWRLFRTRSCIFTTFAGWVFIATQIHLSQISRLDGYKPMQRASVTNAALDRIQQRQNQTTRREKPPHELIEAKASPEARELKILNGESMYTRRTGDQLPSWARRHSALSQNNERNSKQGICFVHVGKTSGSTIACYLGFLYGCDESIQLSSSNRLISQTEHLIHNWINDCPEDDEYYLFSLRDPVARMRSWFTYERPPPGSNPTTYAYQIKKPLFIDCPFSTFYDLVEQGLGDPAVYTNVSAACHQRAWDALVGKTAYTRHNYYNYQYYYNLAPRNATILAIRTEYLQQDWTSAEMIIARDTPDYRPSQITFPQLNPSPNIIERDSSHLSPIGMKNLCRALCWEIKSYLTILSRAVNLTPQDVANSVRLMRSSCPHQVSSALCDEASVF